jgi:hypothetical protein
VARSFWRREVVEKGVCSALGRWYELVVCESVIIKLIATLWHLKHASLWRGI